MTSLQSKATVRLSWFLLPQLLAVSCWAQSELSQNWPEAILKVRTKLETILPAVPPLGGNRLANLRQDTFSVQDSLGRGRDRQLHDVEFFEVFLAAYTVVDGRVQSSAISLDNEPAWLVAVDKSTGQWFYLYGFENAAIVAEFNRLIQALDLDLKNEQQMLELFDYYLKVTKGPVYRASIPTDELSLQAIVSRDYVERYSSDQRTAKFRRWWERVKANRKKLNPPKVRSFGDRFQASFFRYSQDELIAEHVSFKKDGEIVLAQ